MQIAQGLQLFPHVRVYLQVLLRGEPRSLRFGQGVEEGGVQTCRDLRVFGRDVTKLAGVFLQVVQPPARGLRGTASSA